MYMYAHIYLILGFSQMFCLMGNHFFVGIEALGMDEKKRKLKHDENDDLCTKKNGLHSSRSWYELRIFFGGVVKLGWGDGMGWMRRRKGKQVGEDANSMSTVEERKVQHVLSTTMLAKEKRRERKSEKVREREIKSIIGT